MQSTDALTVLSSPPRGLFETPAPALADVLRGPTLIHIAGRAEPPLFISTLLHGNETSGWTALCQALAGPEPPARSILLFVGNVAAARKGVRSLPDQPDFNRIWTGTEGDLGRMVTELLQVVASTPLFLALDLHNNTGRNPHYSVLTRIDQTTRNLALLFSDKAVYVEEPATVLTRALHDLCPSIALEVGCVDDPRSDARALELIRRVLNLEVLPGGDAPLLNLYQSIGRVHIVDGVHYDFADAPEPGSRLTLTAGMEAVNFHPVPPATTFGHTAGAVSDVLRVLSPRHRDVTDEFFRVSEQDIVLRREVVPAMYTTDRDVIHQDCLCYLMERMADQPSPT